MLLAAILAGCSPGPSREATTSSAQTPATSLPLDTAAGERQYRAVCLDARSHGGNEQVLTRWLDTRAKAKEIGDYHADFKYKGHSVRIEERVRPKVPAQ